MRIGGKNYNVRTGLAIFIGISIISAIVIMFLDIDRDTWSSLKKIKPEYGLLACMLMTAQWCFNGVRFRILVNSFGNDVSFLTSLKAFMSNIFMSAMTPSQTGGGPLQIYVLNRAGVPVVEAFTGCLMGAVLTVLCLVVSTLGILLLKPTLRLELGSHIAYIFIIVCIVFFFMFILFTMSLVNIRVVKRIVGRWMLIITKAIKLRKGMLITCRVMNGLDQYSKCMTMYAKTRKYKVFVAGLFTMASISANSTIAPVILRGLNIRHDFLNVFLIQFVLSFISYFSPTPGASGIAEFSNYWMMSSIDIDKSMLGIYTLIWRFFTSFFGVTIGGFVVLSLVKGKKKNLSNAPSVKVKDEG